MTPNARARPGATCAAALLESELELRRRIEAVAAERRKLVLGGEVPTDYRFDEAGPAPGSAQAAWIALSPSSAPRLRVPM